MSAVYNKSNHCLEEDLGLSAPWPPRASDPRVGFPDRFCSPGGSQRRRPSAAGLEDGGRHTDVRLPPISFMSDHLWGSRTGPRGVMEPE